LKYEKRNELSNMAADRLLHKNDATTHRHASVKTHDFAAALNKTATTPNASPLRPVGPKVTKVKGKAVDPRQLASRLSALDAASKLDAGPKPKVLRLEDFPFSTNVLTRPILSRNLPSPFSIANLPLSDRYNLATGAKLTVVVDMSRTPVFTNMPASAIALVSSVANQQFYGAAGFPKRVWFTDGDEDAVEALCWFVRDMFTQEWDRIDAVPRVKEGGLIGLMRCYQAGRAMGMGTYLEALKHAVILELEEMDHGRRDVHGRPISTSHFESLRFAALLTGAGRNDIDHIAMLRLTEKLDANDAVFQLIVGIAAKKRRKSLLRETAYSQRLSVSFPKVVEGMGWVGAVEGVNRKDSQVDVNGWVKELKDMEVEGDGPAWTG
jgi:hypothetical protein